MRKYLIVLLILATHLCSVSAQKASIITNYFYRASPFDDSGVSMEGVMPISEHVFFSPEVGYSFDKDHFNKSKKITSSALNYGVNAHYAFRFRDSDSFVSPFVGIGGITFWNDYMSNDTGRYDDLKKSRFYDVSAKGSQTYILANVGLSFKWFLGELFFVNTQAKYSIFTKKGIDANYFSFSVGLGFVFDIY